MSRRSNVWQHFSPPVQSNSGKSETECKWCHEKFAYHGTTSNLSNHMKRKHPGIKLEEEQLSRGTSSSAKQTRLEHFRPISQARQEEITCLITEFVVADMRPLSVVDGVGFRNLLKNLQPSYAMPSRQTIARRVETMFAGKKLFLKKKLSDVSHASLTCDAWTSINMQGYFAVTCHYIDKDFNVCSAVLGVRPLDDRHTGENITQWIEETLADYDLNPSVVVAAVSDNAANMISAKTLLSRKHGWHNLGCTAHTLQLCIQKGIKIPAIDKALGSARRLVQHFKRSELATSVLQKKCIDLGITPKKLIMDVATRWNSTYYMIDRLLELQWAVISTLSDPTVTQLKNAQTIAPKTSDWELFRQIKPLLKPFADATDILGGQGYTSLSSKYPIIKGLKKHLIIDRDEGCWMKEFRKKVIGEMEQRFSFDIGDIAHKAAALDPRYKLKGLSSVDSTQVKGALELDLAKILQKHSPPHSEAAAPSIQSSPQLSPVGKILKLAFDSSESDSSTDTDPVSMGDEINKYFSLKVVADNKDPLIWWKENENLFPNLVKLVHKYLGIPATSTPSERVFSVAGNTATELRSSLTGSHVEALVFLKANKDLWISK